MSSMTATAKLAAICAAAAAALFLVERGIHDRRATAGDGGTARVLEGVDGFSVSLSNGVKRVFQRADGTWHISTPVSAPAEDARIMALLDAFGRTERIARISSREMELRELGPANFGLSEPSAEVEFHFSNLPPLKISFGAMPPASTNEVFAAIGGEDGVSVLSTRVLDLLWLPVEEFSNRRLCSTPLRDVSRISIERQGTESLRLKRTPEKDGWRITSPEAFPADFGRMMKFLETLSQARIDSFLYGDGADAISTHIATIKLYTDTSTFPDVVTVCAEVPGTGLCAAISDAGAPVAISNDIATALAITPGSIRDRRVFPSGLALNLRRIAISPDSGAAPIVLDRPGDGDWRITEPIPAAADQSAIASIVEEILSLEATEFISAANLLGTEEEPGQPPPEPAAAAAGDQPPAHFISALIASDSATNTIACAFNPSDGNVTVTLDDSAFSAIAPASALSSLQALASDTSQAFSRFIGEYPIREVLSIDVTRDNGTSQRFDVAPDGSMSIGGDDGATEPISDPEAISSMISGMLAFLAHMEAGAVELPEADAPAPSAISVTIEPRNPQFSPVTVHFASPDGDTVRATLGDVSPIFIFPSAVYDYFARNFRESYHAAEPTPQQPQDIRK